VSDPTTPTDDHILLAVNGGLMRGLGATERMAEAGATFIRESSTAPTYRMWSVDDRFPAMLRADAGSGSSIDVEVWSLTPAGLIRIYDGEPGGLLLGWIFLEDGTRVLGVLAEHAVIEGQREITGWGGWRPYIEAEGVAG